MDRPGHQATVHKPPDDLLERFEIDPFETTLPRDEWPDPALVSEPYIVEFPEADQLDPDRATGDETDETTPPAPLPRAALPSVGMAGSLAVHLLPLVLLVAWWTTVPLAASAVPVQLVFEQPKPEPEPLTVGDQPPPSTEAGAEQSSETPPPPQAVAPPPPNSAPAQPPPPPPKTPIVRRAAATVRPKPVTPPKPPEPAPRQAPVATPVAAPAAPRQPPAPRSAAAVSHQETGGPRASGPEESSEAYFSYLVTLTRKHLDLLPMSVLAGRRGKTVIAVRVLDDGTIAETRIAGSSSYPDIDARIQQMVVAVGRFPPLPPSLQGRDAELDLKLSFPDALR